MSYTAPQKDMLFALEHIANMPTIIQDLQLDLDMDTAAGILDEAAKLNQDIIAPTHPVAPACWLSSASNRGLPSTRGSPTAIA